MQAMAHHILIDELWPSRGGLIVLWWITDHNGRSLGQLFAWIGVAIVLYVENMLFDDGCSGGHETWVSPLYFNNVTLTSLGDGDVVLVSCKAWSVAMAKLLTSCITWGGLFSIYSTKHCAMRRMTNV